MLPTFGPRRQGLLSYRPIQSGRTGRAPCLSHVFQHFLPHSTGQTRRSKNHQANQMVFRSFRCARYCGQDGQVGSYHRDEIRNIVGHTTHMHVQPSGAVSAWGGALGTLTDSLSSAQSGTSSIGLQVQFDASRVVPTGPENVPQHYLQPVALYMGRVAQI